MYVSSPAMVMFYLSPESCAVPSAARAQHACCSYPCGCRYAHASLHQPLAHNWYRRYDHRNYDEHTIQLQPGLHYKRYAIGGTHHDDDTISDLVPLWLISSQQRVWSWLLHRWHGAELSHDAYPVNIYLFLRSLFFRQASNRQERQKVRIIHTKRRCTEAF